MNTKLNGKQNSISLDGSSLSIDWTYIATGDGYIRQWGKVVHFHFWFTLKSNVNSKFKEYKIGTIPQALYSGAWFHVTCDSNYYDGTCCVTDRGELMLCSKTILTTGIHMRTGGTYIAR